MNVTDTPHPVLELLENLLQEESKLKKNVNHNPDTLIAAVNMILGAKLTNGYGELMSKIYIVFVP